MERNSAPAEKSVLLTDDRHAREVLKAEWGQWLSTDWDWDWWVTLTYDPRKTRQGSSTNVIDRSMGGYVRDGGPSSIPAVGWTRSEYHWDQWLEEVTHEAALDDAMQSPYWFRGREQNPTGTGPTFTRLSGVLETSLGKRLGTVGTHVMGWLGLSHMTQSGVQAFT